MYVHIYNVHTIYLLMTLYTYIHVELFKCCKYYFMIFDLLWTLDIVCIKCVI